MFDIKRQLLSALNEYLYTKMNKYAELSVNSNTQVMSNYYQGQTKACIEASEMIDMFLKNVCPKRELGQQDFISLIENIRIVRADCIAEASEIDNGLLCSYLKGKEDIYSEVKMILEDYLYA